MRGHPRCRLGHGGSGGKPNGGTARHAQCFRLIQLAAQFTDTDTGAELDFADPYLEVTVVALAGIGGEGRCLVADIRRLIDAGTFCQRRTGLLVADQGVHCDTVGAAMEELADEAKLREGLGMCAAVMSSVSTVMPGRCRGAAGGRCGRGAPDREGRTRALIAR